MVLIGKRLSRTQRCWSVRKCHESNKCANKSKNAENFVLFVHEPMLPGDESVVLCIVMCLMACIYQVGDNKGG